MKQLFHYTEARWEQGCDRPRVLCCLMKKANILDWVVRLSFLVDCHHTHTAWYGAHNINHWLGDWAFIIEGEINGDHEKAKEGFATLLQLYGWDEKMAVLFFQM